MKRVLIGAVLVFSAALAQAAIKGEEVQYKIGDQTFKGYIAYDDAKKGKRPGVLVVHEWWGHNEYARKRARMLAELGYTGFALDMFGDGKVAHHPDEAGKFAGEVRQNMELGKARFNAALETLKKHASVDPNKIGAIGYCFGGAVVLQMARIGFDLKSVASFHGSLGTTEKAWKGKVKAKLLVANGADDSFIKPEEIEGFKKEMDEAGVEYKFINYPGAKHSFTNPDADEYARKFNMPIAYNAEADKQSWAELQAFFKTTLN
jgi:dienelactone hydrolase